MITMDIFNNDAFSVTSMIRSVEKKPYLPSGLDVLVGFEEVPVATDTVFIEVKNGQLNLIQTTLRGAPIEMGKRDGKNIRPFKIPRVAKGDTLFIHELANVRPFDGEDDVATVAKRVDKMQNQLISDTEYTMEFHRLGALGGVILDADGSTLYNLYTEFGVSVPATVDLTLDAATPVPGQLRRDIDTLLVTPLEKASGAGNRPGFQIKAICGADFFNRLVTHPDVEKTYVNQQAAAELRGLPRQMESFFFANVEFIRYRGSDDNVLGITSAQAKVFPTGVPGMFQHIMGPCNEMEETINQMGRRYYPVIERDQSAKRQWVQPEIYSYPLMMNARPDLVLVASI